MTKTSRTLQFVFMLAVSVALGWRPLMSTLTLALRSDEYTHILLILPLSCALVYLQNLRRLPDFKPAVGAGSALLIVALLVASFARGGADGLTPNVRLSLSMFALVTWWIGCIAFYLGIRAFQALLFPLCFLFWLVPIPAIALDAIIHFLQHQSALAARVLFMAAGVPVTQDGIVLSIPGLDIEVVRECSTIRSSLMLIVTTMVLAHLFLRSGWRKAVLTAATVPVAAVKNGLRIFTITQLGTRVDAGFFDGRLHHRGGIIFFAISLAMMAVLLWGLRRTENLESRGLRVASLK
jgi:exosortase